MMIRDLDGMLSRTDPGTPPEVRQSRPMSYLYFQNKSIAVPTGLWCHEGLACLKFMVATMKAAVSQGMDGPDNRPKI